MAFWESVVIPDAVIYILISFDFSKQLCFSLFQWPYGKPNGKLKLLPHFSRSASNDTILNRLCKVYAEKRNEEVMKVEFWVNFAQL